ncbi:MAG: nucleotidyltransferase domain-containing protein [Candidatus Aenigmarchaeota archaeon]|nr:nucleotidyltransferase domain-containing protein [Candidatus Aenigmarchaeota archaeon]
MGKGKSEENKKIIEGVRDFKQVSKKNIGIEKIIIFGSAARGDMSEHSDVDLILVSKKFSQKSFLKRSLGLRKYWKLGYPADFICYTPEEFEREKKKVSIVSEALREGIVV